MNPEATKAFEELAARADAATLQARMQKHHTDEWCLSARNKHYIRTRGYSEVHGRYAQWFRAAGVDHKVVRAFSMHGTWRDVLFAPVWAAVICNSHEKVVPARCRRQLLVVLAKSETQLCAFRTRLFLADKAAKGQAPIIRAMAEAAKSLGLRFKCNPDNLVDYPIRPVRRLT